MVKFKQVEFIKSSYQNMVADVFCPNDPTFPLVEMYYKDEFGKLLAFKLPCQR